jgi:hypothetical protein
MPQPPRHRRDLSPPHRPRLVPLPIVGAHLEPMLHRERGHSELRDLPRPAHERQDLGGPPGGQLPLLSWCRSGAREHGSSAALGPVVASRGPRPRAAEGRRWPGEGESRPIDALSGKAVLEGCENNLPDRSRQGVHRVPHAECLAAVHPFLQDGSLHSRPRSTDLGEVRPPRNGDWLRALELPGHLFLAALIGYGRVWNDRLTLGDEGCPKSIVPNATPPATQR